MTAWAHFFNELAEGFSESVYPRRGGTVPSNDRVGRGIPDGPWLCLTRCDQRARQNRAMLCTTDRLTITRGHENSREADAEKTLTGRFCL